MDEKHHFRRINWKKKLGLFNHFWKKNPIIFSKQISPFATYHNDVINDDIT